MTFFFPSTARQWAYSLLILVCTVFFGSCLYLAMFVRPNPGKINFDPNTRLYSLAFARDEAFDFFQLRANPGRPLSNFDVFDRASNAFTVRELFVPDLFPKQGLLGTGAITMPNPGNSLLLQSDLRFTGNHGVMMRSPAGLGMYDFGMNTYYRLLPFTPPAALFDQAQMRLLYTASQSGGYVLNIRYPLTGFEESVPLTSEMNDISLLLARWALPVQTSMRFSPLMDKTVIIDHTVSSTLFLHIAGLPESRSLKVPFMGDDQIHFSPTFLSNNQLLFSVLDGNQWATVLYTISTDTYKPFSDRFSDAILVSTLGKPVLLQSAVVSPSGEETSIPFGSFALFTKKYLEERGSIPVQSSYSKVIQVLRSDPTGVRPIGKIENLPFESTDSRIPATDVVLKALELSGEYMRIFKANLQKAGQSSFGYYLVDTY